MKRLLFILTVYFCVIVGFGQQAITPETALDAYVHNDDPTWGWEVRNRYPIDDTEVYSLLFISQKWHGMLWKHELIVFVPQSVKQDGALLFIDGGSVNDGIPKFSKEDNALFMFLSALANRNNALVCILKQVPNQPLYGGLKEDALISHTLNEFRKDKDYSWPLLFPMTKTAYKAMDAVQEFAARQLDRQVNRFLVSGASKRGWTTWLTGALQDPRVEAIAPMVIEMLNMPASLDYQKQVYGEYSEEINDYVKLEIPQAIHSEFGNAVVQMIDPYSYREKLTMPKMIFMGTNDPYWVVDAIKHYINDIPGHNLLHYVPNAGHGLGDKRQAFAALGSFFAHMLDKTDYPACEWNLTGKGKNIDLKVKASPDNLVGATLWKSVSDSRDFRKATWTKSDIQLNAKNRSAVDLRIQYPKKGFQAFYVDLVYKDPHGDEYTVSTRTFVSDNKKVFVE
ncbi:PhoPQ-activated pathogenicity-related family protein [Proteiniphilum sp. X52]|uniref:PhoPQ-activated pathogenicity-related family protein n=1 Tax=Proteiniphilum sp. X52 TaxID=2382159 RepID=UPI000F09D3F8|nr:PhoPQ-activated protein PqaA family protein [Proteiniphilum sp. X52]RNC66532.1 PhoPQ-activated pathogenicity-like protein PqaA type [Proteiniphilum sp. X52]